MSSSSSSTVLESSEKCPTATPQPDTTDDEATIQEALCRAENAGRIADGALDENVRLQEQIKQLKFFFIQREQKLVEEKEAAEEDALQAKATAKTARADAGEILGAFKQFVSDLEEREKVFLDGRLDIEKEIRRTVGDVQESEMHVQGMSGVAQAAAGWAETAAHTAQKAVGKAQSVAVEAQTAIRTAVDQAKRDQEKAETQKLETRHKWFLYAFPSDYTTGNLTVVQLDHARPSRKRSSLDKHVV